MRDTPHPGTGRGGNAWPLAPSSLGRFEMGASSPLLITKVALLDCGQYLCLFLSHCFGGAGVWHSEIPRPGIKPMSQQQPEPVP